MLTKSQLDETRIAKKKVPQLDYTFEISLFS